MKESIARVRVVPVVVTVASSTSSAFSQASEPLRIAGPAYSNAHALLNAAIVADAVALYPGDTTQAAEWIAALRKDARYALCPVFLSRACGESIDALCDGIVDNPSSLFARIAAIRERQAVLPVRPYMDEEERLLAFLYTRPEHAIKPSCDWRSEQIYAYPLLDAFAPPGVTGVEWSHALRRRSLIESVGLIDRLRQCPACSGSHLNYVDSCPQCASIDIAESIFLHCYACGHVAKQAAFIAGHSLSCPKCLTRLRHIGVDYDRALEAFSCIACDARFTEPDVKAHCLQCRKASKTDDLQERRVEAYRLSEAGQLAARTGQVGELFALIDEFNCVHPVYFEQTLDFLLSLGRRHPEVEFGLVCLKFANVRELLARLPRVRVSQMIDGFSLRLRELVRTTDMVLRSDDEHCWLLLPQTPPAGLEVLISRINKITEATGVEEQLSLTISVASSRTLGAQSPDAKLLMAELRAQVG